MQPYGSQVEVVYKVERRAGDWLGVDGVSEEYLAAAYSIEKDFSAALLGALAR